MAVCAPQKLLHQGSTGKTTSAACYELTTANIHPYIHPKHSGLLPLPIVLANHGPWQAGPGASPAMPCWAGRMWLIRAARLFLRSHERNMIRPIDAEPLLSAPTDASAAVQEETAYISLGMYAAGAPQTQIQSCQVALQPCNSNTMSDTCPYHLASTVCPGDWLSQHKCSILLAGLWCGSTPQQLMLGSKLGPPL